MRKECYGDVLLLCKQKPVRTIDKKKEFGLCIDHYTEIKCRIYLRSFIEQLHKEHADYLRDKAGKFDEAFRIEEQCK